jgi:ABC-type multidrug transport system fused ATPase/permease subunit
VHIGDPLATHRHSYEQLYNGYEVWLGEQQASKEYFRFVVQLQPFIESLPLGLDTIVGERGITLSGGQRQRMAIARALLRPSELLILDEATSALDLETERRFQALLQQERIGKTTIIVAHRLSTVRDADLILVLDQGRLVEQGTHESLMKCGSYYRSLVESEGDL